MYLSRGRAGGEMDLGVSRCKLLHVEWINKVLWYGTGNDIHYPVVDLTEKKNIMA